MYQGFNPKVQRVPKLKSGKSTPVGFIKVFVFEDLKSEGKDALIAAHDFQGRVLKVGYITFRDSVPAWEFTGHWDQQLAGADNDVPIASWSLLWQAGHQIGGNDFIIYYLQQRKKFKRKGRSLRKTSESSLAAEFILFQKLRQKLATESTACEFIHYNQNVGSSSPMK